MFDNTEHFSLINSLSLSILFACNIIKLGSFYFILISFIKFLSSKPAELIFSDGADLKA